MGAGMRVAMQLIDYHLPGEDEEREAAGQGAADGADSEVVPKSVPQSDPEPGLAGRMSAEEQRAKLLEEAQAVLDRTDELLLEARRAGDAAADGDVTGMPQEDLGEDGAYGGDDAYGGEGRAAGDGTDGDLDATGMPEPDLAEGRLPGNVATGKSGRVGSYEEDGDIVARQVCDMAQREPDPEVRKNLEEKCKSLKSN